MPVMGFVFFRGGWHLFVSFIIACMVWRTRPTRSVGGVLFVKE
jgi:hypothetical protein